MSPETEAVFPIRGALALLVAHPTLPDRRRWLSPSPGPTRGVGCTSPAVRVRPNRLKCVSCCRPASTAGT